MESAFCRRFLIRGFASAGFLPAGTWKENSKFSGRNAMDNVNKRDGKSSFVSSYNRGVEDDRVVSDNDGGLD